MITKAYFAGQTMYITVTNNAKVPSSLKWVNVFLGEGGPVVIRA